MNWHYVEQGQQAGPVSEEQFAELVRSGKITAETLVWREGLANWQPYGTVAAGANSPTAAGATPNAGAETTCVECGKTFPLEETIPHGNVRVCAACKPVLMQKLAEGAQVNTDASDLNFASVPIRFAAVFLDGLILWVAQLAISVLMGFSIGQAVGVEQRTGAVGMQVALVIIQMSIGIAYEIILIGKYGATLGKMACKIKVVNADGSAVSYGRATGRYFAKMLSGFTCLIGYIIAFFDKPQNRALHDRICNTRVVVK